MSESHSLPREHVREPGRVGERARLESNLPDRAGPSAAAPSLPPPFADVLTGRGNASDAE